MQFDFRELLSDQVQEVILIQFSNAVSKLETFKDITRIRGKVAYGKSSCVGW